MAATGYSPIQLYYSTTASAAPTAGNLASGELAINITDGKLYYKDNAGAVQLLSTSTTANGTANGVLYLNGSKVATAGSALVFDGTNLSVGGSNSQQKLNVVVPVFAASASGGMRIGDNGNNYYVDQLITTDASANPTWETKFATHTLSKYFYGGGVNAWAWYANNTEAMRLTSTGLGIGTSSPLARLDVQGGSIKVKGYTSPNYSDGYSLLSGVTGNIGYIQSYYGNGSAVVGAPLTFDASYFAWRNIDAGYAERMRLDSSGNLGLGVTPSAWGTAYGTKVLDIGSVGSLVGSNTDTLLFNNTYWNGTNFLYKTTAAATQYQQVGGAHKWYNAASGTASNVITFTQAMTLDANGNLGVGTSSPGAKLNVASANGAVFLDSTTALAANNGMSLNWRAVADTGGTIANVASILGAKENATSGNYAGYLTFSTESSAGSLTERMRLDSSGNLGLGVTPSAWYSTGYSALQVKGSSLYSTSGNDTNLISNAYLSTTPAWTYISTAAASRYEQASGQHRWHIAPSGTAGNAITFTQAMTLDASGNLLLGTTTAVSGYRAVIGGTTGGLYVGSTPVATSGALLTLRDTSATGSNTTLGSITFSSSPGTDFYIGKKSESAVGSLVFGNANNGTEYARIDSSGNLGLGVTPSAWWSAYKVLEMGALGNSIGAVNAGSQIQISANAFQYGPGTYKYGQTGYASTLYSQSNGAHSWLTAASGTAGNNVTFTQAMTLDASGNLGVGITSPGFRVDFRLASAGTIANFSDGTQNLTIGTAAGNIGFVNGQAGVLGLYTGGSERARIDSSGNLGLGVTPSAWYSTYGTKVFQFAASGSLFGLDVSSSDRRVTLQNNAFINSAGNEIYLNDGAATKYEQRSGQHRWSTVTSGTAGNAITFTQAMTLAASGNLLIGTTTESGSGRLRVVDSIRVADSTSETNALLTTVSATAATIETRYSTPIILGTSAVERARIDSSGNLLVGQTSTTSPGDGNTTTGTAIQSIGKAYFSCSTGRGLTLNRNEDGAVAGFFRSGTQVGSISVTTSATAYNTSSDYRLKDNQQPLTGSGAFIDALQPKTWNWKADGSRGVGFIAHEVQEVSPGSVVGEKDGEQMQAMEYGSAEFIANIIAELQSLRKRLADAGIA